MSTTIGTVASEGIFDNSVEVYNGTEHIVLFVQNGNDRDGKGTKILLDNEKSKKLIELIEIARMDKDWE